MEIEQIWNIYILLYNCKIIKKIIFNKNIYKIFIFSIIHFKSKFNELLILELYIILLIYLDYYLDLF